MHDLKRFGLTKDKWALTPVVFLITCTCICSGDTVPCILYAFSHLIRANI